MNEISAAQWLGWIISTATASAGVVIFAFSQFETKQHARDKKDDIDKRLDRIENKIDFLLKEKV